MFCALTPLNDYEIYQYRLRQQQQQLQEELQQRALAAAIARRLYQQRQQELHKQSILQELYNQRRKEQLRSHILATALEQQQQQPHATKSQQFPWRVVSINKREQQQQQHDREDDWEDVKEPMAVENTPSDGLARKIPIKYAHELETCTDVPVAVSSVATDSTAVDTEMGDLVDESESTSGKEAEKDGQESDIMQEEPKNGSVDAASVSINPEIKNIATIDAGDDDDETITQDSDSSDQQQPHDSQKSLATLHSISSALHAEFQTSGDKSGWHTRLSNMSESLKIDPETRKLVMGSKYNRPLLEVEEKLTKILLQLDSVESFGDVQVRDERKRLIWEVQGFLDDIEQVKIEAGEKYLRL